MATTVQSRKQKGRKLQQWVRDKIRFYFNLSDDDVRSTSMGAGGEDILLSSSAKRLFSYSIECKNAERVNVWSAYAQACANNAKDTEPLVVIKRNRHKALAVVDAEEFIKLVRLTHNKVSVKEESNDT